MHTPHPTRRSLSQKVNLHNQRSHLSKRVLLISCSLALLSVSLVGLTSVAQAQQNSDEANTLTTNTAPAIPAQAVRLCDLIDKPEAYQNKVIRIDTMAVATAELSFLYDRGCAWPKPAVDLEFGSKEALTKVTPFSDFSRGKNSERRAYVTMVGRFEGPRPDGYGHLGGFEFRFTATEVLRVERVPDSVPSSWPGPVNPKQGSDPNIMSSPTENVDEPLTIKFCDLVRGGSRYNNRLVRTTATALTNHSEVAYLYSSDCNRKSAYMHFEMVTEEGGQGMDAALAPPRRGLVVRANVTIVGRFFSGQRYGHLDTFFHELMIERVERLGPPF